MSQASLLPFCLRLAAILALLWSGAAAAQPAQDSLDAFLLRLQQAVSTADPAAVAALADPAASGGLVEELLSGGAIRRVVRELERREVVQRSNDRRIIIERFEEWPGRARVVTTALTVRRATEDAAGLWRIADAETLGVVEGLYKLRLDTTRQYSVRDFLITAPDLRLSLESGNVFLIDSDAGVAGAVLTGQGEMHFTPEPETERGQLRLFAGAPALTAAFEHALVRFHPSEYAQLVAPDALRPVPVARDAVRRAIEIVERELPKSLTVDLREVSRDLWHLLPRPGDRVADVRTRRHGTLTYARFGTQPEDISLVDRERRLTIAVYSSPEMLSRRGPYWDEEDLREYDVLNYDIDASISPARRFMIGRTRMTLRARTPLTTLNLRLAEPLVVTAMSSSEKGPLSHLRLRNQNMLLVRIPGTLAAGDTLTLDVQYSGLVTSQPLDLDALQFAPPAVPAEPHLLLSSASYWYPQNPFADRATATIRVAVPKDYRPVASGEELPPADDVAAGTGNAQDERVTVFRAARPVRYLAVLVSRLRNVHQQTLTLDAGGAEQAVHVSIEANPLLRARAEDLVEPAADILGFYTSLLGDVPFPSATIAAVESDLPGGHSPGYFVMLNTPFSLTSVTWQNDPAAFIGFPEFFLAHELAHQWWGQAVGVKNYHERWISEGFAQYFAALYAEQRHGERVFRDMLRQFRRWSISESDMGPVYLGHRLGQLRGGPRTVRALVYNKGAAVLHMLRRTVGDAVFFRALRRFYTEYRFASAGTDDVRTIFEAESGRPLARFFDRWIYGAEIPRIEDRSELVDGRLTIRLQQMSDRPFDVPVTATITYDDGSTEELILVMDDTSFERTAGDGRRVRKVEFNKDSGALAEIED